MSPYGVALADELSRILPSGARGMAVIDRSLLKDFLIRGRVPSRLVASESAQRCLGKHFNADIVLSVHFLSVADKNRTGQTFTVKPIPPSETQDLCPRELFTGLLPSDLSQFPGTVYISKYKGVSKPSCFYMPSLSYTEAARKAEFSANVLVGAVIDTDGKLKARRILLGACCGLNETSLQTLSTWKCKPALLDGKPVPVAASFEVNFRLYRAR